jgi:hypothetical protein
MEPCLQEPTTGPYSLPDESNPHPKPYFTVINFNIIPCLHLGLSTCLFPSGFPTRILNAFNISPMRASCPPYLTLLHFIILIIFRGVQIMKLDVV